MGVLGADLLSGPGELTEVGSVFVETYQNLQRCEGFSSSVAANSAVPMGDSAASESDSASSGPSVSGEK